MSTAWRTLRDLGWMFPLGFASNYALASVFVDDPSDAAWLAAACGGVGSALLAAFHRYGRQCAPRHEPSLPVREYRIPGIGPAQAGRV